MIGFIITRHVTNEATNRYWNESYRCIRKFYPNEIIMIIDDNSKTKFVKQEDDIFLTNCFIIKSEFPGSGELLPYYYFLKYRLFDKAVILHDSVFIQRWIDFDSMTETGCPLWHFVQYPTDNTVEETELLRVMDHSDELEHLYWNKDLWKGCFGAQVVISYDFLLKLEEKYHFTRLTSKINYREKRSQFERVIAVLLTAENKELETKPSIYGVIYSYIQWGIPYEVYLEQRGTILKQELIKVWTTR